MMSSSAAYGARHLSFARKAIIGLRQHRKLQYQHGNRGGGDGQEPVRDPCGKIEIIVHVNAPLTEVTYESTECAAERCATNRVPDRVLSAA